MICVVKLKVSSPVHVILCQWFHSKRNPPDSQIHAVSLLNPFIVSSHSLCFLGGFFCRLLVTWVIQYPRERRMEGSLFSHLMKRHGGVRKDVGISISPLFFQPRDLKLRGRAI